MAGSNEGYKISFHSLYPSAWFTRRKLLKKFIAKKLASEGKHIGQLNIIFCSDEYLLGINNQYLKHDDYTDIITFNLEPKSTQLYGDIYISIPRVLENSSLFENPRSQELHRVIFHGILHLCGYNDKKLPHKAEMTRMENKWLKRYREYVSREIRST